MAATKYLLRLKKGEVLKVVAVNHATEITALGRGKLPFPLHPRYSRMLLAAQERGELRPNLDLQAVARAINAWPMPALRKRAFTPMLSMTANRRGEPICGHKRQRELADGNEAGDGKAAQAGRKRRKYLKCRKKSYR